MTSDQQTTIASDRRIVSIDALRGLVVFAMIYVNDIAGVSGEIVPAWMRHFRGPDGMTFVDLVFPAFVFIVGMSVPLALGARSRHLLEDIAFVGAVTGNDHDEIGYEVVAALELNV